MFTGMVLLINGKKIWLKNGQFKIKYISFNIKIFLIKILSELVLKKGDTIEIFLQRVRQQLRADFVEMKSQSVDQMMFVKVWVLNFENFIICEIYKI